MIVSALQRFRASQATRYGFTLVEFMVAMAIVVLLSVVAWVFTESTGRTLSSASNQSDFNQKAGHAAEFLIYRIRMANTVSNDASGNTLTLSFDDDPTVDSDGDGIKWNDKDHFEEFKYNDTDGVATTLLDNTITYKTNNTVNVSTMLVPQSVRKLSSMKVFTLTNTTTVLINFGLLYTNNYAQSQMIEVRTQARLRNKLQ
jgi:prepilin-type N-terminal cleavage/methylation domain-containing protein